jgi:competence protein ComEA
MRSRAARQLAEERLHAIVRPWRAGPAAADREPRPAVARDSWPDGDRAESDRTLTLVGWRRSAVRGLVLLVALAGLVAGYGAWQSQPRAVAAAPTLAASGVPIPATVAVAPDPVPAAMAQPEAPAPEASEVVVHVAGKVAHPGLVRLPTGSRVADAIDAAGGVTGRGTADSVNLARVLIDGEQIVVGTVGQDAAPGAAPAAAPAVLNLNSATAVELDGLPGVGPVLAQRIIAWRALNGPFRGVDELGEVSGIGDSILSQVRPLVRV